MFEVYRDDFDIAYEEGTLFLLTLHPHLIGMRSRIGYLDQLIHYIKSKPNVWFATGEAIATVREDTGGTDELGDNNMGIQRIVVVGCLLLLPAAAGAQGLGAIAGVVRDTSGGVLPGVTVEAASPALIERARTVVTDGQGVYRIVDLRPGLYTVTFSLAGFSTLERKGIELSAAFTATVNADLPVGTVEETLTVSGASPVVDVQNVLQQQTLARSTLDAIPMTKRLGAYAALLPGAVSTAQDVGGIMGERGAAFSIHGGRSGDISTQQDGMTLTVLNSEPSAGTRTTRRKCPCRRAPFRRRAWPRACW